MSKEEIKDTDKLVDEVQETEGDLLSSDERFIELEIIKESNRIDKEVWFETEEKQAFVDLKEFNKGITDGAYLGGFYTALINSGVGVASAVELILNQQTLLHNQEMARIDIEKTKVQSVLVSNQQI